MVARIALRPLMLALAMIVPISLDGRATTPSDHNTLETFGPLPLPFAQTADLNLVLETDLGVLAPQLQSIPRDDTTLRTSGVLIDAGELVTEVGWGHAAPYLYSAVIDTLGRLYYSLTIDQMRLSDGTELLQRGNLPKGTLRIRVISNRDRYLELSRGTRHAGQDGYWNPGNNEVGIFIDATILNLARRLENPELPSARMRAVETLRAYLYQRIIYKVGHELFHAIQSAKSNAAYLFPMINEATAMLAQDNLLLRENAKVLLQATSPTEDKASDARCWADGLRGFNLYRLIRMRRAYAALARDPAFSVTALLAMDDNEFGAASGQDMLDRYAISYAFTDVLLDLNREELAPYKAVFDELIAKARMDSSLGDAANVDMIFRQRVAAFGRDLWMSPQADEKFEAAKRRVTACLKSGNLPNAFAAATEAYAYKPTSPTGPLYAGDVFYRDAQPLLALDFYLMAREAYQKPGADDYRTRIETRVADAQELTGDLEDAVATYAAIANQPPENPPMLLPWLRAAMKAEYYKRIQERGIVIRLKHVEQANRTLDRFSAALDTDPRYAAAIASNNLQDYQAVVRENGLAIREDMMREAETVAP